MLRRLTTIIILTLLAGHCGEAGAGSQRMVLGANVNETGAALKLELLKASHTTFLVSAGGALLKSDLQRAEAAQRGLGTGNSLCQRKLLYRRLHELAS